MTWEGDAGNNTRRGSDAKDIMYGRGGDDSLYGEGGDDILYGGEGQDFLSGGQGADILYGGLHNDVYYADEDDGIFEYEGGGVDTVYARTNITVGAHIEVIRAFDSSKDISLSVTLDHVASNMLIGDSGNNRLSGGYGDDHLIGQLGDDTYIIHDAGDIIVERAGEGNDKLIAYVSYTLDAGVDVETLEIAAYSHDVTLTGNELKNTLRGNAYDNTLLGGGGDDTLEGKGANDTLDGGSGTNTAVYSGASTDYIVTKNANGTFTIADKRHEKDGTDLLKNIKFVKFSDKTVDLQPPPPDPKPDPVEPGPVTPGPGGTPGTPAPVEPTPSQSGQVLTGTRTKNTLTGGAGNDKINGGYGNDILTGGTGQDVFVFDARLGTSKTDRKVNFDTITDFSVADDTIWLDNKVFKKLGKGSEASPVQLNSKYFKVGKAKDKNDYILYDKKTGVLSYDADGSGSKYTPLEFAKLAKNLSLSAADFCVV
ncbi:calcium-binding protein [Microvirga guangxiensis]|uniref:calcium-binding protein n=1 Tax=Microvirga guangxiensis TaxID=549386 RepID=UPI0015877DBD|nr:calcium-binding protein [Microvirga guangxiensis]